jgi:pyrimidine-nucleoside phosphorylase
LPTAPHQSPVTEATSGYLAAIDCEMIGRASMVLGGGRAKFSDAIDPRVGIEMKKRIGDRIEPGDVSAIFHHADVGLQEAFTLFHDAIKISDVKPPSADLFIERIAGDGGTTR